jgi:hypothetical protein
VLGAPLSLLKNLTDFTIINDASGAPALHNGSTPTATTSKNYRNQKAMGSG